MAAIQSILTGEDRISLRDLSVPAKGLITATLFVFAVAMAGALGQIIVHDIVPTFFSGGEHTTSTPAPVPEWEGDGRGDLLGQDASAGPARGDLFAGEAQVAPAAHDSLLEDEQFLWTLTWTHIHLFGMNMIFILMGPITLLLGLSARTRTWLVVLPFVGVLIDIAAMWLKNFVSSVFFWLHVPGGLMFGAIFAFVAVRALWEMWGRETPSTSL